MLRFGPIPQRCRMAPMSVSLRLPALTGLAVSGLLAAAGAMAQVPATTAGGSVAEVRKLIAARFPEIRPEQISASPVAGLYEVRIDSKIAYVSADGRYMVQGDIFDLDSERNLTESRLEGVRKDVLAGLRESGMVIFAPAKYQDTVTVFTDIDCGYCRKLHRQMADYNARGIRVRYLYFPRSGPGSESWLKSEQIACAKDPRAALTKAKMGEVLKDKACKPNPVAEHYNIGREFGLQGTPAIVLESGELIGGYLEPDELAKHLAEAKTAKVAKQ
ncbi:MAG: DsbC family protein [Gammaproteobacteria bacterium]|nr:DsbC family protein [Gammaproteobacteria bacterium]